MTYLAVIDQWDKDVHVPLAEWLQQWRGREDCNVLVAADYSHVIVVSLEGEEVDAAKGPT